MKHLTKDHKRKISESLKGHPVSEEQKEKWRKTHTGYRHSIETKIKMRKAQLGKPCSELAKEKLRKLWIRQPVKCEVCGKEILRPPSSIKRCKHVFCSLRCHGIWRILHIKKKDTSIELKVEGELQKRSIPYLKQCPINNIAIVDFLLPNKIIVQCDGNYWHKLPRAKIRDADQGLAMMFLGYRIFRFTETEINKSASKCISKVLKS